MTTIRDEIGEFFGINSLAASELIGASEHLSKAYQNLSKTYKTAHITTTENTLAKIRVLQAKKDRHSLLDKATKAFTSLPSDTKSMWASYTLAVVARNQFVAVCRAHQIDGQIDINITKSFDIRRENNDFMMGGNDVAVGRDAFDTLTNKGSVFRNELTLGKLVKPIPQIEG